MVQVGWDPALRDVFMIFGRMQRDYVWSLKASWGSAGDEVNGVERGIFTHIWLK